MIKGVNSIFTYLELRFQKNIVINHNRLFTEIEGVVRTVGDFYSREVSVTAIFPALKDNVTCNYSKKQNKIVLITFWNKVKIREISIPVFKKIDNYKFTCG